MAIGTDSMPTSSTTPTTSSSAADRATRRRRWRGMATLMTRLGWEVNAKKTRIARLPEESFDFLGYTVGRFHGKNGRPYIATRPSRKSVKSLLGRIHQRTTRQWYRSEEHTSE